MPHLIVIGGPTASGKTTAAIHLATFLNCPILSADSRQFFKEMSIGTAKPTATELKQAQHFFIDNKSIEEDYSAGQFEKDALDVLQEIFKTHQYAILVGGSGLYIDALCKGMDDLPKDPEIRALYNTKFEAAGIEVLQEELHKLDPEYYANCDNQNPVRLIRALEIITTSGKKMSEHHSHSKKQRPFTCHHIVLTWPREVLYERINQRVDLMMQQGLLQEVESLLPYREKNALQTVGYQELFDYLDGHFDMKRAVELIKQNSRRYAKRQITWFKRNPDALWLHPSAFENPQSVMEQLNLSRNLTSNNNQNPES
jgi:tRNA dimethylallyltransferase